MDSDYWWLYLNYVHQINSECVACKAFSPVEVFKFLSLNVWLNWYLVNKSQAFHGYNIVISWTYFRIFNRVHTPEMKFFLKMFKDSCCLFERFKGLYSWTEGRIYNYMYSISILQQELPRTIAWQYG